MLCSFKRYQALMGTKTFTIKLLRSEISYISNDLASEWNDSEKSYCAWNENIRYPTIGEYDPIMNDYYM